MIFIFIIIDIVITGLFSVLEGKWIRPRFDYLVTSKARVTFLASSFTLGVVLSPGSCEK